MPEAAARASSRRVGPASSVGLAVRCAKRIGRVDWSSARPTVGVFGCLAACAASVAEARCQVAAEAIMPATTTLLPFQLDAMTPAQLAAVSYLARYSGHTHELYAYQLRRWFGWCEANGLDAVLGVQRAHVELYIRHLRDCGLRDSSICTMMHGVRGFFRFAHIDGLIPPTPRCTSGCPGSTPMRPAPKGWTGSS
jgi:Phage integrase, N-terminal SAM-like domain